MVDKLEKRLNNRKHVGGNMMGKNLVIVESPSKSKTIQKYLGADFEVTSSKGHIRDLATTGKGGLGVDVENDFKPHYVINKDKKDVVKELKKCVKEADYVYLATDPDREGEAISWHLAEVLGLDETLTNRIVFNEITHDAVINALNIPNVPIYDDVVNNTNVVPTVVEETIDIPNMNLNNIPEKEEKKIVNPTKELFQMLLRKEDDENHSLEDYLELKKYLVAQK